MFSIACIAAKGINNGKQQKNGEIMPVNHKSI
jgi:hypothetical protein